MNYQKGAAALLLCAAFFTGCANGQPPAESLPKTPETSQNVQVETAEQSSMPGKTLQTNFDDAQWVDIVNETPVYAQADGQGEPLFTVPHSIEPLCLERQNGFCRCLFGTKEGWIKEDALSPKLEPKKCDLPDFLPPELQLLMLKAQSLYNAYCPGIQTSSGYRGFTQVDEEFLVTSESGWRYAPERVYPTLLQWQEALESVFTPEFTKECFLNVNEDSIANWIEQDGALYFIGGDRGTSCPGEVAYELVEKNEDHIRFNALALWESNQPYRVEYPIEMVKTADGWRFNDFITQRADLTWDELKEKAKEDKSEDAQSLSFLNEEQKELYKNASCWVYPLWGSTDNLAHASVGQNFVWRSEDIVQNGDREYMLYENSYDQFKEAFCKVFTEECWQRLEESRRYVNWDGILAADLELGAKMQQGCTASVQRDHPDEFRLESSTETQVVFTLIAHYDSTPEQDKMTVVTREYPIRMEKTPNGWRVAEFHSAEFG